MSVTWNANAYIDPVVKEFVSALKGLLRSYAAWVEPDDGTVSLMVKAKGQYHGGRKLIEYWPLKNRVVKTEDNHRNIRVKPELSRLYHTAIDREGYLVQNPEVFIRLLKTIIEDLFMAKPRPKS